MGDNSGDHAASCMGCGYGAALLLVAAFTSFFTWVSMGWWALIEAPLTMFVVLIGPVNLMLLMASKSSLADWAGSGDKGAQGCLAAAGGAMLASMLLVPIMAVFVPR
jgi:hypothetical protein